MTNSILGKLFIFAVGAAIGSAVTWKFVEAKYKKLADEDIASYKEMCERKYGGYDTAKKAEPEESSTKGSPENDANAEAIAKAVDICKKEGYDMNVDECGRDMSKPYVIRPDEFGQFDDYRQVSLSYYEKDKVLTDELDNPIEDVDMMVGLDSLTHFGQYEDDSVYVRNDERMTDYEILLDIRGYGELVAKGLITREEYDDGYTDYEDDEE